LLALQQQLAGQQSAVKGALSQHLSDAYSIRGEDGRNPQS
jgi:hypothetical protein